MKCSFFIFEMSEGKQRSVEELKSEMLRPILPISLDYYEKK